MKAVVLPAARRSSHVSLPHLRLWQAALVVLGLCLVYLMWGWPWMTNWGATPAEQAMALPGDELTPTAAGFGTRAITIHAPAEQVWPWLVQLGQDKAAFYSHDWLENLFWVDYHNADEIHPEWQDLQKDGLVRGAAADYLGGRLGSELGWRMKVFEPGKALYLWGPLVLLPVDANTSRLIARTPLNSTRGVSWLLGAMLYDPMHFVMERGMLLGVRDRAEGRRTSALVEGLARMAWAAAWLLVALALGSLPGRRGWLAFLPLGLFVATLFTTSDPRASIAWFLATGIPLAGFLGVGRAFATPFLLVAAVVLLTLLLIPNSFVAFGVLFGATIGALLRTRALAVWTSDYPLQF